MTVPFNRPCPQCGGEMELLASDELGAVVVYECAEFNVLVRIAEKLCRRLERRVKPLCLGRGMPARDVAVLCVRKVLRVLREKHRYVL